MPHLRLPLDAGPQQARQHLGKQDRLGAEGPAEGRVADGQQPDQASWDCPRAGMPAEQITKSIEEWAAEQNTTQCIEWAAPGWSLPGLLLGWHACAATHSMNFRRCSSRMRRPHTACRLASLHSNTWSSQQKRRQLGTPAQQSRNRRQKRQQPEEASWDGGMPATHLVSFRPGKQPDRPS